MNIRRRVRFLGVLGFIATLPGLHRLWPRWARASFARAFVRALADSQGGDGRTLYVRTRWLDDGGEVFELNPDAPLYDEAVANEMVPRTIVVPGKRAGGPEH